MYLIDLETGSVEQTIDYDTLDNWEGRVALGLRIAFYEDELPAPARVFVTPRLPSCQVDSKRIPRHCHETTYAHSSHLHCATRARVRSSGAPVLERYYIRFKAHRRLNMLGFQHCSEPRDSIRPMPRLRVFDPNSDEGPPPATPATQQRFLRHGVVFISGHVQAPPGDQRPKALEHSASLSNATPSFRGS